MISVIVPTFNVDKYFDRCMDSIINQTFKEFEVIIVDGNSTDGTIMREDAWLKKDNRVRRIFQKSKGLGPARDEGVAEAKGDLITFIDSDDWWDLTYLEKMHRALVDADADIVMCDRFNYHFDSDGGITEKYPMTKPVMFDGAESFAENPEIINMIEVSSNGKLYKRDLFVKNNIVTPCSAAEDRAVLHYLVYKASKIVRVYEPLYFYHAQRGGSLVNTVKAWKSIPVCLEAQQDYFHDDSGYDGSIDTILRAISTDTALAAVESIRRIPGGTDDKEAGQLLETIKQCHWKRYPDLFEKQYIIGSYSLRREVWLAYHSFEEIRVHQQFSSIISLMSDPIDVGTDSSLKVDYNSRK
jgi:glycosyltransferase involved in cell wall biosynthesis